MKIILPLLFLLITCGAPSNEQEQTTEKIEKTFDGIPENLVRKYRNHLNKIKKDPMNPRLYNQLGDLYFKNKDHENAELMFDFALRLDSNYIPALFNKSLLYRKKNQTGRSIALLEKAYSIEPDNIRILTNLSQYYYQIKDHDKFLEFTRAAYQLEPQNSDLTYNLAIAYQTRGEYESAIEFYQKTLDLNPKHKEAKTRLESLYHLKSQQEKE